MELSKPSSDIATSSKANSDIAVHCKANSDIGVFTLSKLISNSKSLTNDKNNWPTREASEKIAESKEKPETSSKEDANHSKPVLNTEPVVTSANKPVVANVKVVKRGKLVHRPNSIDNNFPSYSFVSRNSFENVLEVEPSEEIEHHHSSISHSMFESEKSKLHSKIENYCYKHEILQNKNKIPKCSEIFDSNRAVGFVKPIVKIDSSQNLKINCDKKLQKSQSFVNNNPNGKLNPEIKNCSRTSSFNRIQTPLNITDEKSILKSYDGKFSREKLVKIPTISHLDDIECHLENMPECRILEPIIGNYISEKKYSKKNLKYSMSFQNSKLKDTKITNFEQPQFLLSRSFSSRLNSKSELVPKLGAYRMTDCYKNPIISTNEKEFNYNSLDSIDCEIDFTPPPLSKLQIFAISTKPEDIQIGPMDSIPNEIDKLPSLPIINHYSDNKNEMEKKLSILEPPPPGLVSREESNKNWNQFLLNLNSILENRVEEFV